MIVDVCRLLRGLCTNIISLLTMFAKLNNKIKQLVREHKDTKRLVADIEHDLRDASDDENEGMSIEDYDNFRNQLHEMRKLSLMINSMSTLYAEIITDVINPGFDRVIEAAYENGGETNTSVIIYNKQRDMSEYLAGAETICQTREEAADASLSQKLADVDVFHASSMRKKRGQGKRIRKPVKDRSSFVSRLFSRS